VRKIESLSILKSFLREKLSPSFRMPDFMHSEVANWDGKRDIPEDLDLVLEAEGDRKRAQECIANALSTIEGFEVRGPPFRRLSVRAASPARSWRNARAMLSAVSSSAAMTASPKDV
jgi:hypothetical protein